MSKEKITYNQAISAINAINPAQFKNGQFIREQSDLSKIKGRVGTDIYFLKNDISQACKPLDDRSQSISNQRAELQEKIKTLRNGKADKKLSTEKAEEQVADIQAKIDALMEDYEELMFEQVEISLTRGKLKLSEIEEFLTSDHHSALNWAIDYEK